MSTDTPHILLIDDDDVDRSQIERLLRDEFRISVATTAAQARPLLEEQRFDGVLLDHRLPDVVGLEFLEQLVEQQLPVVMLTRKGSQSLAVDAMKRGARDYLLKEDLNSENLLSSLRFAMDLQRTESRARA